MKIIKFIVLCLIRLEYIFFVPNIRELTGTLRYQTPKPFLLKQLVEPIGKDNDRYILESEDIFKKKKDKAIALSFQSNYN